MEVDVRDGTSEDRPVVDWQAELWRSLTSPLLRPVWLAMAVVAAVSTAGCLWTLAVNLPLAIEGRYGGARPLQWAMVLLALAGGVATWGSWRMHRRSGRHPDRARPDGP